MSQQAAVRAVRSPRQTQAPPLAPSEVVVEAAGLTKRYGEVTAVSQLDFRLFKGEVFGLLGPNGAGKTTTILMMMGLTEPTAGSINVWGLNPAREPLRVKRIVGYLPEHVAFYDDLSARENLYFTADLNGLTMRETRKRAERLLARVGLSDVAEKPVGQFSHGMRQRLGIADVLIKEPKLVFLDEPTLGIDPEGVNQLLDIIAEMSRDEQITILLCSHQLQQVQSICHRVGIFVKGRMIADGPIAKLAEQLAQGIRTIEVQVGPDDADVAAALRGITGVVAVEREGSLAIVRASRDVRSEIAQEVLARGWALLLLRQRDFGLEEIYLRYFREG